ncbi:hypothetical protein GNI_120250 [Gregarina niphandrodes]|uniref:Uncharacterized protein n=1 Tax=Gregarina niphandrodes TaxID=110365 RepID=A0A023B315_GRENI|nr:hypothetical protein GNI_120250 [Gregarina niphandrodes]EZG54627.1 hypothetical protein GNI_120250 [Gregarina niphandrodes]|eukprot:XP_011131833.1 hypothetical protein GNI_120250 [Gregarina niphandrodes]
MQTLNSTQTVKYTETPYSTQTVNSTQTVDSTQTVKCTETPYSTQTVNSTQTPYSRETVNSTQTANSREAVTSTTLTPLDVEGIVTKSNVFTDAVETVLEELSPNGSGEETDETFNEVLPVGKMVKFAELNKPGMFVDDVSQRDLQSFRAPYAKCLAMDFNPETSDVIVSGPGYDPYLNYDLCGSGSNGTLMCRDLGVRNAQCFNFVSGIEDDPNGLYQLWDMIDRVFSPNGDEDCVIRCDNASIIGDKLVKAAEQRKSMRRMTGPGDARTPEGLERFKQVIKQMFPPDTIAKSKNDLSHIWFKIPCGNGTWTPGEQYPDCKCPKLIVTCGMERRWGDKLDLSFAADNTTTQEVFTDGARAMTHLPHSQVKRCDYQCLSRVFSDV